MCRGSQADLRQEEDRTHLQGGHQAYLQAGGHVNFFKGIKVSRMILINIPGNGYLLLLFARLTFTETL